MSETEKVAHFSVFEYMYRDAGNFKSHGALLLVGYLFEADATVRNCLEWSDQFVAEQLGIRSLCPAHWEAVGEGRSDLGRLLLIKLPHLIHEGRSEEH